jgi:hypothetical protein
MDGEAVPGPAGPLGDGIPNYYEVTLILNLL